MNGVNGTDSVEPEVLLVERDGLARITLNRPRAINALNLAMVRRIAAALTGWACDPAITTVVLDGAGERGLCAGGDIRAIYHDLVNGGTESPDFLFEEYRLNHQIATYPKPFVALMDGLVMGGGIGLSAHASHRVVTDRTVAGMPEVKIGLVPDVGGTYLLSRSPGQLGLRMALTGATGTGADAVELGLADRLVHHQDLPALVERIAERGADAALSEASAHPANSALAAARPWIDDCYAAATVEQIVENLRRHPADAARADLQAITPASPIALKLTLRAIRAAASLDLPQSLNQEFGLLCALFASAGPVEGIRAQVIDKDRNPTWVPNRLAAVSDRALDHYFAPPPRRPFEPADPTAPALAGEPS